MLLLKPSRMISLCTPPLQKLRALLTQAIGVTRRSSRGLWQVFSMLQSSNKGLTICDFRFGRGGAKEACGLLVACWSRRAVVVLRNEDCLLPGVSHAMSPCPGYQNEVTIFDFGFGGGAKGVTWSMWHAGAGAQFSLCETMTARRPVRHKQWVHMHVNTFN